MNNNTRALRQSDVGFQPRDRLLSWLRRRKRLGFETLPFRLVVFICAPEHAARPDQAFNSFPFKSASSRVLILIQAGVTPTGQLSLAL